MQASGLSSDVFHGLASPTLAAYQPRIGDMGNGASVADSPVFGLEAVRFSGLAIRACL